MGFTSMQDLDLETVSAFLLSEREKVLSETEWRHRMKGYGFRIRRTDCGVEVARLPKGQVLGTLAI